MIHTSDPLERLRAANPIPAASLTHDRPDPVLFAAIVSGALDGRSRTGPGRRRLRLLVPALAVTSLVGGPVAYALLRDPAPKPQNAGCYETADLEARTEVVGVGPEGPLAACAELWLAGVFGPGAAAPALTECLLPTGIVGVFPADRGGDVCAALRGGSPTTTRVTAPGVADANERFLAFRDEVLPRFLDAPCVDPRSGSDLVRRELDRAGLGDWRVAPAGEFTADRPCATLGFRPESGEVALVPSPPRR